MASVSFLYYVRPKVSFYSTGRRRVNSSQSAMSCHGVIRNVGACTQDPRAVPLLCGGPSLPFSSLFYGLSACASSACCTGMPRAPCLIPSLSVVRDQIAYRHSRFHKCVKTANTSFCQPSVPHLQQAAVYSTNV